MQRKRSTLLRRLAVLLLCCVLVLPLVAVVGWWFCYSYIDNAYVAASRGDSTRAKVRRHAGLLRERDVTLSALPAHFGRDYPAGPCFEYKLFGPFRFIVLYDSAERVVVTFPVYE